jgi:hypothetical protein
LLGLQPKIERPNAQPFLFEEPFQQQTIISFQGSVTDESFLQQQPVNILETCFGGRRQLNPLMKSTYSNSQNFYCFNLCALFYGDLGLGAC